MHIRLLYRKFLCVFISLAIVIAPSIQQANAASVWSVTNSVSSGSRVIVTATKGGYKSAVNIAPSAGRLALKLGKGANWAALLYAAIQLAPDLADIKSFQPQYAEGRIKYTVNPNPNIIPPGLYMWASHQNDLSTANFNTPEEAGRARCAATTGYKQFVGGYYLTEDAWNVDCKGTSGKWFAYVSRHKDPNYVPPAPEVKYMSIASVAPKVAANAKNGHADSREAVKQTAIEMVVTGDFDKDLLSGAVPVSDSRPLIPAVPITGNGNVASGDFDASAGGGSGVDGGMTGGDVGAAADAAIKAAESARKSAQAAADVYRDAADAARVAADEAASVINSAVDQAIKDIAAASAAASAQAAADAKSVADASSAASAQAAADAVRAADAAAATTAQAVKDANAALEAAKTAADATAESIAQAQAAADTAVKAAEVAKEKAKEAEKAKDKSKVEAKPFELPAFCTWASVVCEYTQWVKDEYALTMDWIRRDPSDLMPVQIPIDDEPNIDGWQGKAEASYVQFDGQCPADVQIPIAFMGASSNMSLSYIPFCHFASLIKYAVILGAWIGALMIISGGRSKE